MNTQTGEFNGYGMYYNPRAKLLLMGQIKAGGFFEGTGVAYDFSGDHTMVYSGQLQANMKHGLGVLIRHRTLTFAQVEKQLLEGCTARTYRRVIDLQLE